MSSRPEMVELAKGTRLITQGQAGTHIFLVLDGVLVVDVDGEKVAELGPGAIVGERATLGTGKATGTVTATTPVRVARILATEVERATLEEVSKAHRREEPSRS